MSNVFSILSESRIMWRIDARYSLNGPVIRSELETSELVKNSLVRHFGKRGYLITIKEITREDVMEKTIFSVPPLKNDQTDMFCQKVAAEYLISKDSANKMYADFCNENKLPYWVTLAMKERISYLVRQQNAVTQPQ